jgi:DHA2 family multidrug resistance protein
MTTLVAPVVGPLLGGWITDNLHWPWIFYINVPVGLLRGLTWSDLPQPRDPHARVPIDTVGLVLLVLWVGAAADAGQGQGGRLVRVDRDRRAGAGGRGRLRAVFLVWELTDKHPIVDLRLFAAQLLRRRAGHLAIGYGLFSGNVVLLPLWLQQWMGYTATWAGWRWRRWACGRSGCARTSTRTPTTSRSSCRCCCRAWPARCSSSR